MGVALSSTCCCCVIGVAGRWFRTIRLIVEPHVGNPSLTKRRAKPRMLPSSPVLDAPPAWPCKGGDAARTGSPGISATRCLNEPAWVYFTDAVTYSTTVLDAAGNIYFNAQSGLVHCLNASGEELWRYKLKGHFPPCPALLNGCIFTFDTKGYGYSLDMLTGNERWVRSFAVPTGPSCAGPDCWSVAAANGLVIFQLNSMPMKLYGVDHVEYADVVGVDPACGDEIWRYRAGSLYNVMPAIAVGKVFFSSSDMDLYCLEAKTGHEVWRLPGWTWERGSGVAATAPRSLGSITIYREDRIYMTGNPTKRTGIARAHRSGTGEILWRRKFAQHVGNAAALSDACGVLTMVVGIGHTCPLGEIFKNECPPYLGTVYGLNAVTGEVLWQYEAPPLGKDKLETYWNLAPGQKLNSHWPRLNLPDSFSMPAIGSDGTVYIGWQAGFILALDGKTGELVSSFETKEGIQAQPTIGPAGELVVAAGRHLLCFAD